MTKKNDKKKDEILDVLKIVEDNDLHASQDVEISKDLTKDKDAQNAQNKSQRDKSQEISQEHATAQSDSKSTDNSTVISKSNNDKSIMSDDDILAVASERLRGKKEVEQSKIEDTFQKAIQALENKKSESEIDVQDEIENLQKTFDAYKRNVHNSNIKNNIARSSIDSSLKDKIDFERNEETLSVQEEHEREIGNINAQIDLLNEKKETALDQLDLAIASQIETQIRELESERRQKQIDNATKKNDSSNSSAVNYSARYDEALQYFTSLDPEIAVSALLSTHNMKYYLGDKYDVLLDELLSRDPRSNPNK